MQPVETYTNSQQTKREHGPSTYYSTREQQLPPSPSATTTRTKRNVMAPPSPSSASLSPPAAFSLPPRRFSVTTGSAATGAGGGKGLSAGAATTRGGGGGKGGIPTSAGVSSSASSRSGMGGRDHYRRQNRYYRRHDREREKVEAGTAVKEEDDNDDEAARLSRVRDRLSVIAWGEDTDDNDDGDDDEEEYDDCDCDCSCNVNADMLVQTGSGDIDDYPSSTARDGNDNETQRRRKAVSNEEGMEVVGERDGGSGRHNRYCRCRDRGSYRSRNSRRRRHHHSRYHNQRYQPKRPTPRIGGTETSAFYVVVVAAADTKENEWEGVEEEGGQQSLQRNGSFLSRNSRRQDNSGSSHSLKSGDYDTGNESRSAGGDGSICRSSISPPTPSSSAALRAEESVLSTMMDASPRVKTEPKTDSSSALSRTPAAGDSDEALYDRTAKVMKVRYTDHGSHGKVVLPIKSSGERQGSRNILKKLVYQARDTFNIIDQSTDLVDDVNDLSRTPESSLSGGGGAEEGGRGSHTARHDGNRKTPKSPLSGRSGKKRVSPATEDEEPMKSLSPSRRRGMAQAGQMRGWRLEEGIESGSSDREPETVSSQFYQGVSCGAVGTDGVLTSTTLVQSQSSVCSGDGGCVGTASVGMSANGVPLSRATGGGERLVRSEKSAPSHPSRNDPPSSLLHAALQGGHTSGSSSKDDIRGAEKQNYVSSAASSLPRQLHEDNNFRVQSKTQSRGECLTNPSTPMSNEGLDNCEGNLIIHRHDVLRVPGHQVYEHSSSGAAVKGKEDPSPNWSSSRSSSRFVEFQVLSPLGQGTFAQVFKCRNLSTGQLVAVKIVKNKPAYTRQAAVEIEVFRALAKDQAAPNSRHHSHQHARGIIPDEIGGSSNRGGSGNDKMVKLLCYFMYESHLCLVFELLGLNLYEVLKRRQFRGLPIGVVRTLVKQAVEGLKDLSQRTVVHCDLKPENMLIADDDATASIVGAGDTEVKTTLLASEGSGSRSRTESCTVSGDSPVSDTSGRTSHAINTPTEQDQRRIKLIDFGSACFEGQTAHTYIQSRFYRSPEVLVGLPYDSAIDMWSLGCVAAELFLGLPILPGVHEHDQLGRICEMIGFLPDWMIDQGSKSSKYFVKYFPRSVDPVGVHRHSIHPPRTPPPRTPSPGTGSGSPPPPRPSWRLKTRQEYIESLSEEERRIKGGLAKLEQQPTSRYFKRKKLSDIIMVYGHCSTAEEKETLGLFVHFLNGLLDPDPWKRWTANQALMHPFITGSTVHRRRVANDLHVSRQESLSADQATMVFDVKWVPPWDPAICRRKLLSVQKAREKQEAMLRGSRKYGGSAASATMSNQYYSAVSPRGTSSNNESVRVQSSPERAPSFRLGDPVSPELSGVSRVAAMTDAMSLSQSRQSNSALAPGADGSLHAGAVSPPPTLRTDVLENRRQFHHLHLHGSAVPHIYQTQFSGSLGSAVGGVHHRSGNGIFAPPLPPSYYSFHPSSLSQIHQIGGAFIDGQYPPTAGMSPDLYGASSVYGENPYNLYQHHVPQPTGPQSFSGVYSDRISTHHLPIAGELGFALQRPGVVPSMSSDVYNASAISQQQVTPLAYLHPPHLGRSGSFTNAAGRRRRTSFGSFSTHSEMSPRDQSQFLHTQEYFTEAPSAIQEDDLYVNEMQRGTQHIDGAGSSRNTSFSSHSGSTVTSLLAQQLAEHCASRELHDSVSERQHHPNAQTYSLAIADTSQQRDGLQQFSAQSQQQNQGLVYGRSGAPSLGYYATYMSPNGIPLVMSAPVNVDPRVAVFADNLDQVPASYGVYGSYQDSFQQLSHQHLNFPPGMPASSEGMERQVYNSGIENYPPPPPPRPPPPYRGMSM